MTSPVGSGSPSIDAAATSGFDGGLSAIYVAISDLRTNEVSFGQGTVLQDQADAKHEEAVEQAAIKQEQANAANSGGGFFSCIGHLVGDVAKDLVTGHVGGALEDGAHDVEQAWNSPKFWSDLALGCEDVAIVAGAATATVATAGVAGVGVSAGAVVAITATGAVAGAGASLAKGRVMHFAANVEDASADATAADNGLARLQQLTADVLGDLKQTDASHEHVIQAVGEAVQTYDETAVGPASMTVKG